MAQYMSDILGDEVKERLAENLLVGPNKLPMENFLTRFMWDGAKFPLRQPLPNIVEGISKVRPWPPLFAHRPSLPPPSPAGLSD